MLIHIHTKYFFVTVNFILWFFLTRRCLIWHNMSLLLCFNNFHVNLLFLLSLLIMLCEKPLYNWQGNPRANKPVSYQFCNIACKAKMQLTSCSLQSVNNGVLLAHILHTPQYIFWYLYSVNKTNQHPPLLSTLLINVKLINYYSYSLNILLLFTACKQRWEILSYTSHSKISIPLLLKHSILFYVPLILKSAIPIP